MGGGCERIRVQILGGTLLSHASYINQFYKPFTDLSLEIIIFRLPYLFCQKTGSLASNRRSLLSEFENSGVAEEEAEFLNMCSKGLRHLCVGAGKRGRIFEISNIQRSPWKHTRSCMNEKRPLLNSFQMWKTGICQQKELDNKSTLAGSSGVGKEEVKFLKQ